MAQSISADRIPMARRMALITQMREALRRNPKNAVLHLDLAGLLVAEGNQTDAVIHLKNALALRKKDPDILRRLVSVLFELRQFSEARKYGRKLCEIEPRDPQNHKHYGLVLEFSGNPLGAIQAYEKAVRLRRNDAETLHDIGRCYSLAGDNDKAREYFEAALAADPGYAFAYYSLSTIKTFNMETVGSFVSRIETAIPITTDPPTLANLHYAAGKALDDAGKPDEAFPWFARANAVRAPENPAALTIPFANTIEAFDTDFFTIRARAGLNTGRPIFIFGLPRSGTTLVESLCGAHSAVTAGDEQVFMTRLGKALGREASAVGAYARNIRALKPAEIRAMAEEYLEMCKPIAGATPHFTDKLPHNFQNLGLIALLFPNAKLIHCRRHPLDNCFSLYSNSMQPYHNSYKTDLTRLGMYYRQYAQLMQHWKKHLPLAMHEVFYEDMIVNTELNARNLIGYLGLDWEDGVMDRKGSQRSVRTLSGWQVRQPVYQTSRGKWLKYKDHLGPLIDAIGPYAAMYEAELKLLETSGQP